MDSRGQVKERIKAWLAKIPKDESDVPYLIIKGKNRIVAISPDKAVEKLSSEKEQLSFYGASIVKSLAHEDTNTTGELIDPKTIPIDDLRKLGVDIILEQYKKRLDKSPESQERRIFNLSGESYTLKEIYEEMQKDTEIGKQFRSMYKLLYDYYVGKM